MSECQGDVMYDLKQMEIRMVTLEHRVQGHAESILLLHKRTDDNTAILNKIQSTLSKLLYIATGFCLYYAAATIGFLDALKLVVL